MSSYFFHLKLELYPTPASSNRRQKTLHSAGDRNRVSVETVFVPPPGSDIFKAHLPAHRTSQWPSYSFAKREDSPQGNGTTPPLHCLDRSDSPHHLSPESDCRNSHGNALLLPERSLNLRKEPATSPRTPVTTRHSNEGAATDWRYERIEIETIDMEKSKATGLHTKAVYLPGDSKTTQVGWGVVRLYRDTEEKQALARDGESSGAKANRSNDIFDIDDCSTLCILAVPSWMMPPDLLGFVGDQAREDVSNFRLIRTDRANKYMVLMKFRSAKKARDWQHIYNGRLFSAAEPENCHVVFIKNVEFLSTEDDSNTASFPRNNHDPFMSNSGAGSGTLSKPLAPPPPNLLELPTCPVCLERMDETTGLLTILCQHVFHCACLEKWRGSGCPVCRYTHSPSYTFPYPRPGSEAEEEQEPMCSVCAGTNSLWICLICGNIGCGRYDQAHAFEHYEGTSHCYAMDISTQHVWDYAGDGYVHRLIQSKPPPTPAAHEHNSSGFVDMPIRRRHENEAFRAEGGDSVPREKMESMAAEYTYLLTSQLEGQRKYFEEQVKRSADKAEQASRRAEEAATSASKYQTEIQSYRASHEEIQMKLEQLEKSLDKANTTKKRFEDMARDFQKKFQQEQSMSDGLHVRIKAAEEQAKAAKAEAEKAREEKNELADLNNDLQMFISSQEKIKELQAQGEEVVDGNAFAPEPPSKSKKGKGKKK